MLLLLYLYSQLVEIPCFLSDVFIYVMISIYYGLLLLDLHDMIFYIENNYGWFIA